MLKMVGCGWIQADCKSLDFGLRWFESNHHQPYPGQFSRKRKQPVPDVLCCFLLLETCRGLQLVVPTIILEEVKNWSADLVVLGSHGSKGLTRFLLGSVSETIVRHAPCSVEVVTARGGSAEPA